MNPEKNKKIIRENLLFYIIGFLILAGMKIFYSGAGMKIFYSGAGMKIFYSGAGCRQLNWLLAPTAGWVETLSGIPFLYEPGAGYVNHGLRILVAPSCSGFRFMTITFAMLFFSFLHKIGPSKEKHMEISFVKPKKGPKTCLKKGGWLLTSLLLSYLLTIFVNGLRIIAALYLPDFLRRADISPAFLTPDRLHTLIGIVVYFSALLAIYRLSACFFGEKVFSSADSLRKCLLPLFWYFFFTLGIPALGRAYEKNGAEFAEYALLLLSGCGILLLPHLLTVLVKKHQKS